MRLIRQPRQTPDLYSNELILEIATDLKIKDVEDIKYFKECLEHAALHYIASKRKLNTRFTEAEELKKFKQLEESLNKAKKLYNELISTKQMASFRYIDGLIKCKTDYPDIKKYFLDITHDGFFLHPEKIAHAIDVILFNSRSLFLNRHRSNQNL